MMFKNQVLIERITYNYPELDSDRKNYYSVSELGSSKKFTYGVKELDSSRKNYL